MSKRKWLFTWVATKGVKIMINKLMQQKRKWPSKFSYMLSFGERNDHARKKMDCVIFGYQWSSDVNRQTYEFEKKRKESL